METYLEASQANRLVHGCGLQVHERGRQVHSITPSALARGAGAFLVTVLRGLLARSPRTACLSGYAQWALHPDTWRLPFIPELSIYKRLIFIAQHSQCTGEAQYFGESWAGGNSFCKDRSHFITMNPLSLPTPEVFCTCECSSPGDNTRGQCGGQLLTRPLFGSQVTSRGEPGQGLTSQPCHAQ